MQVATSDQQQGSGEPVEPDGTRTRIQGTFRHRMFSDVSDKDWNDWRWQFRNRVTTLDELAQHLPMAAETLHIRREVLRDFRMGITPYYLSLIDPEDPHDPILRQVVPLEAEYYFRAIGDEDPLGEEKLSPVPGITHRYPDRVLMVISNSCAIYCRYCTRKRIMYEDATPDIEIDAMVDYIARTPAVRDVVVSGGDPLTYATPKLERILAKLRAIPHLEIIRIGSRVPVALPQRVDDELCRMMEKFHPLWVNVHFNHPNEVTPEAARACDRLLRSGIPVNNQSVLLKGINDSVDTMKRLVHGLMKMRVRPYYLYQCDPIRGAEHFRTPISKGLEIIAGLRGQTSGLGVPTFVVDAPGGGGKIPLQPGYLVSYDASAGRAVLRNFQGREVEYFDPGVGFPEFIDGVEIGAVAGNGTASWAKESTNGHTYSPDDSRVVGKSHWAKIGAARLINFPLAPQESVRDVVDAAAIAAEVRELSPEMGTHAESRVTKKKSTRTKRGTKRGMAAKKRAVCARRSKRRSDRLR